VEADLLLVKVLAIVMAFGVLTIVLLALLDAVAESARRRLLLRRRFRTKRLRSRPDLEDTQELAPVQLPRRGF
jgi:hypothetical protein